MAAAATAVKLHVRVSRLQESAVVLQERAWVREAVRDLAKKGKFLLDVISTQSFNHAPYVGAATGAAIVGSSGLLPSRPTKSAGIISNDPVESLVANLVANRDHGSSKLKLQLVQAQTAAGADLGRDSQGVIPSARKLGAAKTERRSPLVQSTEEDYGWETDPNGGWLASFP